MKIINKHIAVAVMTALTFSCTNDTVDDLREVRGNGPSEMTPETFSAGSVDFSKYVAVGASFTAGFADGGLFVAGQENAFPKILSEKFGILPSEFKQPLMNDNTGGILVNGNAVSGYRLVFDGTGPTPLNAFLASQMFPVPDITTEATNSIAMNGPYNNMGIPGAKSFHIGFQGYAALNPFYTRIATGPAATVLGDAVAQNPTFFTLSEMGGNDVLGYATSGGTGVDQQGNLNPATYGPNDITDTNVFANAINSAITALTANNAKGLVTNVPYITDLAHFTTVPHNPLDPSNPSFGPQIPTLNMVFGALNPIFQAIDPNRVIVFSSTQASPVVIHDEDLNDISALITAALNASPTFPAFLQSLGITAPPANVAALLGNRYGQSRQATEADLLVLPSSRVIGQVNQTVAAALVNAGLPAQVAGQFSIEGVTLPLEDKWVLVGSERNAIKDATDAYNMTLRTITDANPNVGLVDLNAVLTEASTSGIVFDDYLLNTDLVTGGLVSLDGVHLTARGYALMANKFLEALDENFGSNFVAAQRLAKAEDFNVLYSPGL